MRCPSCGLRFEADNLVRVTGTGVAHISVSGNRVSCPRPQCGGMAEQELSGTFEVPSSGGWRLLADTLLSPDATHENLLALTETLRSAQSSGAGTEQIAAEIKASVPALAGVGDFLTSQPRP